MNKVLLILLVFLFSLTTISILLPSSPLFGQESGTLYPWETSSGNVWKTFGDVAFQPHYKGEITNGKPHGVGILYNGNLGWDQKIEVYLFSPRSRYIGEWVNGKMHGRGTFTHFDGSKKIGIFKQGKDWETTWYGSLGNTIKKISKGNIVLMEKYNGILYGQSTSDSIIWFQTSLDFTDGKYEGNIEQGKPNGMGKVIFKNGDKYEGSWIDGKLDGKGTFISSDGTKYIGEWINGKYHSIGRLIYSDGLYKVGEFKKGTDWNTKWYSLDDEITGEYVNGILVSGGNLSDK